MVSYLSLKVSIQLISLASRELAEVKEWTVLTYQVSIQLISLASRERSVSQGSGQRIQESVSIQLISLASREGEVQSVTGDYASVFPFN
ncbi:hypothetical protein NIES298_23460 [Microcystis aeruginosa NIES-298]|nr:hypothetical protein NIES298_23460 [Microcystis aeruginosa NIES-298]